MPPSCIIKNEHIANVAVTPMLLVNVAEKGIRPKILPNRMKKNIVNKYGTNLSYPLPMVVCAISSRTNIMKTSKKFAIPLGTRDCLYFFATMVKVIKTSNADSHIKITCLVGVISIPNRVGN